MKIEVVLMIMTMILDIQGGPLMMTSLIWRTVDNRIISKISHNIDIKS